jgi:serine/threonine-protein kinase RsbW
MFTYNTFCLTSNLHKIRDFLRFNMKQKNVSDKEQNLIILAVDEICSNSMIHGNLENSNSPLDICISYESNQVVIDIVDKGIEFNFNGYKEPNIDQLILAKQKGSMGLMIVKKIMDKIEFHRENDMNVCRLVKKLSIA